MIVVDAEIIASMTFPTQHSAAVQSLHERDPVWEAPLIWKSGFLNVISLYFRKKMIDHEDAENALTFAERLIGTREHLVPAKAVMDAAFRSTRPAYGCEFVVLADQLGTRLVTYDKKLIEEFPELAITPDAYLKA